MAAEGEFTIKELGAILGIDPHKVNQSVKPAVLKMMRLTLANPAKAHRLESWALDTIQAEKDMTPIVEALAAHKRNGQPHASPRR